jgi:hypothetical protein
MSKHTPGPWLIEPDVYSVGVYSLLTAIDTSDAEEQANARLIAAAPELLQALKKVLKTYDEQLYTQDWDAIRRVIAKAEGAEGSSAAVKNPGGL